MSSGSLLMAEKEKGKESALAYIFLKNAQVQFSPYPLCKEKKIRFFGACAACIGVLQALPATLWRPGTNETEAFCWTPFFATN
jgi:hypothetical protein